MAQAHRELLALGMAGYGDVLVEITPIGRGRPARDLVHETYIAWAEHRKYRVLMVREPMADHEPIMIAVGAEAGGAAGWSGPPFHQLLCARIDAGQKAGKS